MSTPKRKGILRDTVGKKTQTSFIRPRRRSGSQPRERGYNDRWEWIATHASWKCPKGPRKNRVVAGEIPRVAAAWRWSAVPSWSAVEAEAPELAGLARGLLDTRVHKTLATLRRDGSPRISGIEVEFADGELWFGGMWRSLKALDLRRDPRFALHSGSADPPDWTGDAKIAGRVEEVTDPERKAEIIGENAPPGPSHLFRADVTELAVVRLGDPADHLVIETWHAGRGVARRERR